MITEDVGGIHIKYLHHCRRQLWMYGLGFRPELHSDYVQRSVFEGELSSAQLKRFRSAVEAVIDRSYDSVLVYAFPRGTRPEHDQWGAGEPAPSDIL